MKNVILSAIVSIVYLMIINVAGAKPDNKGNAPDKSNTPPAEESILDLSTCDDNPAITENGEFSIELSGVTNENDEVTFIYEVCKLGIGPDVKDLSHWNIRLGQFLDCLSEGNTLADLIVGCEIGGEDSEICELVFPDPTTQIVGLKFDNLNLGDGECQTFSLTLDQSVLSPDFKIDTGCVLAATKAGNQDIRKENKPRPGYASVQGPVCVLAEPEISCDLSSDTIDFGDVFVGLLDLGFVTISNTGVTDFLVSGITSDNPAVTIINPLPVTIGAGESLVVGVQIICFLEGAISGSISLEIDGAPAPCGQISLTGSCLLLPLPPPPPPGPGPSPDFGI